MAMVSAFRGVEYRGLFGTLRVLVDGVPLVLLAPGAIGLLCRECWGRTLLVASIWCHYASALTVSAEVFLLSRPGGLFAHWHWHINPVVTVLLWALFVTAYLCHEEVTRQLRR